MNHNSLDTSVNHSLPIHCSNLSQDIDGANKRNSAITRRSVNSQEGPVAGVKREPDIKEGAPWAYGGEYGHGPTSKHGRRKAPNVVTMTPAGGQTAMNHRGN